MARNRILKKEFWCDEKIIELLYIERLLFLGMTNFADDKGIQLYSPKGLKAKIFPADDLSANAIENGLTKMEELGLIEFGNDNTLIRIKNWDLHQKINRPYPSKFDFIEENNDDSMNNHGTFHEHSSPNNKNKKKNNNKKKKKKKYNNEFCVWYDIYPKKIAKPKAEISFNVMMKNYSLGEIMDGTTLWVEYWENSHTEKRYIPHPATFLNQERFMDTPDELESEVVYSLDSTGNFYIGYCSNPKCKQSAFYRKEELSLDSKCCRAKILPSRDVNEIQDINAEA